MLPLRVNARMRLKECFKSERSFGPTVSLVAAWVWCCGPHRLPRADISMTHYTRQMMNRLVNTQIGAKVSEARERLTNIRVEGVEVGAIYAMHELDDKVDEIEAEALQHWSRLSPAGARAEAPPHFVSLIAEIDFVREQIGARLEKPKAKDVAPTTNRVIVNGGTNMFAAGGDVNGSMNVTIGHALKQLEEEIKASPHTGLTKANMLNVLKRLVKDVGPTILKTAIEVGGKHLEGP